MNLTLVKLRKEEKLFRSKSKKEITSRLLVLIELVKLRDKTGRFQDWQIVTIADRYDLSARTVYRWKLSYEQDGAWALNPRKATGQPVTAIRGWPAKYIREWRRLYNWGAEVIQAHLRESHGIKIGLWRINEFLRRNGFIAKTRKKKLKNKHTKIILVKTPGEFCQIDVKHLPHLISGQKIYVYNFVDHASRWEFKFAFESYGPSETEMFLRMLFPRVPFVIQKIQSDNGVEFTNKFISHIDNPKKHAMDIVCEQKSIRHKLIPVGEKELNGLVERSHRMDDEELYHRTKTEKIGEFNKILRTHTDWKNSKRRRKALLWKTPNEYIENQTKINLDLQNQTQMINNEAAQELKAA